MLFVLYSGKKCIFFFVLFSILLMNRLIPFIPLNLLVNNIRLCDKSLDDYSDTQQSPKNLKFRHVFVWRQRICSPICSVRRVASVPVIDSVAFAS